MKILILSCNTGEGHNAAAGAIEEAARKRGHEAEILDMMLLSGNRTSKVIGGLYIGIVTKIPWLFGFIYKLGKVLSSPKRKSPVYLFNIQFAKKLEKYILDNGFDAVISSHLYPAETITRMKIKGMIKVPSVAVQTDYTTIPFWEETNCDYYVIPHEDLLSISLNCGLSEDRILPYGIPVRQTFLEKKGKRIARDLCSLPLDVPIYLVMSGSMGFGKLVLFSITLAHNCKNGEHIVIICGNNKKIYTILKREFQNNERVHILGYTNQVANYMEACDIIYTKPGGLTSTEALVKMIPIVHTAPIPGCETANRDFFVSHGLSFSSNNIIKQISLGESLINDQKIRENMLDHQQSNRRPEAADKIVEFLENLEGKKSRYKSEKYK